MARIIGVRDLYIAPLIVDSEGGAEWDTPVEVPSLMSVDIADNTEQVTFYSNDVVEQVIPAFSGKEVTIELGYLPPRIESIITGNKIVDGVYEQSANAIAPNVALLFRAPKSSCKTEDMGAEPTLIGDGAFRYICLYKGVLSRNEASYQGKQDTIESSNVTLNGVFMPLTYNGEVERRADNDVTFGTSVEVQAGTVDVDVTVKPDYINMIENWFKTIECDIQDITTFSRKPKASAKKNENKK